jgi:glycosyltransferase involved in cell wall biosynthesis
MRVGLNAHLLSFGTTYRGAGISRYVRNLLAALRERRDAVRFELFLGDHRVPPELAAAPGFRLHLSRWPTARPAVRILWEQTALPWLAARLRLDVLHGLGYALPVASRVPAIVTVYDLSFLTHPKAHTRISRSYLRLMAPWAARRARLVLTISEHSRREIVRWLGIPAERVRVVYPGVEPVFRPLDPATVAAFRAAQHLDGPWALFVGTLEPRKNVERLLEALATVRRSGQPLRLLIAGAPGWGRERLRERCGALGLGDAVRFTGYLPGPDLPLWYNAVDIFVYPSLYEGFGLPPLEAMACGTPVISSNAASLPEVVGDAGLLVEPTDVDALADALRTLVGEPCLRAELRRRGLARAAGFAWGRAAEQTLALYREVVRC